MAYSESVEKCTWHTFNLAVFVAGREEDDPLSRRQDREHQGREVHPGLQGRIRGDEEDHRKYPNFSLTINFPLAEFALNLGGCFVTLRCQVCPRRLEICSTLSSKVAAFATFRDSSSDHWFPPNHLSFLVLKPTNLVRITQVTLLVSRIGPS